MHLTTHSLPETEQKCEFCQFALVLIMVNVKLQVFLLLAWKECALWDEVHGLIPTSFSFSFCFNREI